MPILTLGISYRSAPVSLLERLAFGQDDLPKAYRKLVEEDAVTGGVILSTCNRVEVIADVQSYHAGFLGLKRFLSEAREVDPDEFAEPMYSHYEADAAEHLFSVAAGIDSMVVGEPQILTQVRQAHRWAEGERATTPLMDALFRSAVRAGKRARMETGIGASPSAFVEVGVDLAERTLKGIGGRPVLVVGAGAMASLSVDHLRARGAGPLRVINRSPERAARLADRAGAEARGLDEVVPSLAEADLVVSSTGATGIVIGESDVAAAMGGRPGRPLFMLDLAVPRDIEATVARVRGVTLATIEDLRGALESRGATVLAEVDRARAIVGEEVDRFAAWRSAVRLAPLIRALRTKGDRVRAAELARIAPRMAEMDERQRKAVEAMAAGIVSKLIHDPIVRLKDLSAPDTSDSYARAFAELFGLDLPPDR